MNHPSISHLASSTSETFEVFATRVVFSKYETTGLTLLVPSSLLYKLDLLFELFDLGGNVYDGWKRTIRVCVVEYGLVTENFV